MKILVLGASGMLGNVVFRVLGEISGWKVFGTVRSPNSKRFFKEELSNKLLEGIDVERENSLIQLFNRVRPSVVINCIGLVKQLVEANDPLQTIPINTLLPHRLARLCELIEARLVHISTDCVFAGNKGCYREVDPSDAEDLYGRSKYLGEVTYPHTVTLRTSIIGHELNSAHGLIDWFLSQQNQCKGYTKAIFSGVPTIIMGRIIRDLVIPDSNLSGLYHVAAKPISKYELLKLIARVYGKNIEILPDDQVRVNRSLNASRFFEATGFLAPEWEEMIQSMYNYYKQDR